MERLGEGIGGALRRLGVPDTGVLVAVTRAWPDAVGPAIARSAWPLRISRDGTLQVAVISATWANELALLEPEIRTKLTAALGDTACPAAMRFAIGPVPSPGADPRVVPVPPPPPDAAAITKATALASVIEDPELRDVVRRAAAASLAARAAGRYL